MQPHEWIEGDRRAWADGRQGADALGLQVVERNFAAVEWWTTMVDEGHQITLPGCLVLRFAPGGRCEELREYWELAEGYRERTPGWGE